MRERQHNPQVAAGKPLQRALNLGEATSGERRRMPLEDHGLARRQHVQAMGTLERVGELLVRQVGATRRAGDLLDALTASRQHLRRIPEHERTGADQLWRQRHEALGQMRALITKAFVQIPGVAIAGRVDRDRRDVAQRALRQRGERR